LLRLSARGADLEAEVNLPELRPGADQSPTLEPLQRREDVNRAGPFVVVQAEDNLPAAILVDGERPPGDRRGTDLPGSAVAPAHVVDPAHDLLGPGGVTKPQVVGGLGIGSGLRVHRLGVIRGYRRERGDGWVCVGGLGEHLLHVGVGEDGGVAAGLGRRDGPAAGVIGGEGLRAAGTVATAPHVVPDIGRVPVAVADRRGGGRGPRAAGLRGAARPRRPRVVMHLSRAGGGPAARLDPGGLPGLAAGQGPACPACPSRSAGVAAPPPAAGGTVRVGAAGRAVRAYTATATARAHAAAAAARTIRDDLVMSRLPSGSGCPLGGHATGPAPGLLANQAPTRPR